jgi:predicted nuclease of predicted toxin-antitoxin system
MKIVVDMNLSSDWVPALRSVGIEAVHWAAVGAGNASDEAIMEWAEANDAVVLTRDLDFAAILTMERAGSPSIIQLRIGQVRPERHVGLVERAVALHHAHLEGGAIITIEEQRTRVRVLDRDPEL